MYCNLDIKYKAGRSKKEETREKKEVKAKNVGTVRERERDPETDLYFKEIKCSFVRQFNNCKITENGSNTIICVRKKDRL